MNQHSKSTTQIIMVFVLLLGSFLSALAETFLNNALPTIMAEVHVSQTTAQWLSTGYLLVAGIMMPTAAYFTNRIKLKPLFLGTISIFLSGLIISATAQSFTILLLGRLIQAASVGVSMPLVQNVLTLIFPAEKRGIALGIGGIVINLGPAIGPTLSGIIVTHWSWRMLFIALIPIACLVLVLGIFTIGNVTDTRSDHLDMPSLIMSIFGFGGLLFGLSQIGVSGNLDVTSLFEILSGLLVISLFCKRQLSLKHPLLELRVFTAPSFRKVALLAVLTNIALMGPELVIPLYNQTIRGTNAMTSGLLMLPGTILMAILSPLSGKLYDRFGIKRLVSVGFTATFFATIPMIFFDASTSLNTIAFLYAIRSAGLTLVFMPLTTSGLNALPHSYLVYGSTMIVTLQQLASSLGTAALVTAIKLGHGFQWAFTLVLIIGAFCLIISATLKNKTVTEI
ncbi:DHA2 family efflux MFS transporter permease subunit [Pediococcus ethanolidurans]|uniref:MDR family MFS transporter n=1 Tax=Pediococcus ethanolidurans TaxID=319653 RepID=UPI0029541E4C|nr:MDR family MFS transporter [Pediococcus ethanolidurans]MDV7720325.1 DHA2 family efflux MFS transporter permease subunit [Pediococcus ethanolidurans]